MLQNIQNKNVYHGSDTLIKKPDLSLCKAGKDFGTGFYITTDRQQAINYANIVAKRKGVYSGIVNIYKLSDLQGLTVYEFPTTDRDWFNCVIGNRSRRYESLAYPWRNYDLLIGKIADDDTSQVINAYLSGVFGNVGSEQAIQFAISRFLPNKLNNQFCFRTDKALQKLSFMRGDKV